MVTGAAPPQKALQQGQSLAAAPLLAARTGIGRQGEIGGDGDRAGIEALQELLNAV